MDSMEGFLIEFGAAIIAMLNGVVWTLWRAHHCSVGQSCMDSWNVATAIMNMHVWALITANKLDMNDMFVTTSCQSTPTFLLA